ncbi:DUF4139 domain-containing protein [Azospirillum sp.]|uniref:DUF4139 domain-containing protein n=1 Tax=Azospirillum sp. TaxID=34012 RepID=UPI003D70CB6D
MLRPTLLVLTAVLTAGPAWAEGLTLKRVLLSTGGVGYFEHEAEVAGDAELTLEVRRDQVDDVLKSIVVYDDKGGVGTIGLPGEEPLRELFRELPFGPEALESPTALLTALKGAEVRTAGSREIAGRLLSVTEETAALPNGGGTTVRHRVTLMTPDGLQQVLLEDAESLRLADPALQAQVDSALAATAKHTARDRRSLTIRSTGEGPRTVRVGYVVAAPLWKATYRLTLPAGEAKAGDLQGWAVLENMSGADWTGVDLTVVSGNPVTFRQALYTAYYVNRPEVPVEVLGRVLPRPDEGAVTMPMAAARSAEMAPPPPAPGATPVAKMAPAPTPRSAQPAAAEGTEATTQVLFRYPQPVSAPNGSSLLLPIVARAVPAARLDLYQPATQPRHPLAAVRLDNDSGTGLPPGVLTLYERDGGTVSYVGDAQLAALPAGEQRLLSVAVDQKVRIDRAEQPSQTLSRASIVDGVLHLTVTERQTTTYTVAGAAREPRTVIVEHPRRPGWTLVEPAGAREATPTAYRLPVEVPAGATVTLTAVAEQPRQEQVALTGLSSDRIAAYAASSELPPALREALGRVAALRTAVAERERRVGAVERERDEVIKDQARLRENLGPLPPNSDLARRTAAKMGEAETQLERLAKDLATARKDVDEARRTLADAVRGMRVQ